MSKTSTNPSEAEFHCLECDYNLTGAPGRQCPWCGLEIDVDLLAAGIGPRWTVQRVGVALAGLVVGIGSMIAIAFLVSGRKHLSLRDGLVVMGVLLAAAGHVATAAAALLGRLRWPIRNRELASLVLFAASVSIVACVIGATTAAEPTAKRVVRGVEVTGVMEFVLAATLFTIPGWTLLVLRLVAFCPSDHASGGSTHERSKRSISLPGRAPFLVEACGLYRPEQITAVEVSDSPPLNPSAEALIQRTWEAELALAQETGVILHNGALARLIRAEATSTSLRLELARTCYRNFVGTNLHNTAATLKIGAEYLANPLGISANVMTLDGHLVYGRRSRRVAHHAAYLHAFGGMVEPSDRTPKAEYDLFTGIRRELTEELPIQNGELNHVVVIGLVRDRATQQPELIFDVTLTVPRAVLAERFSRSSVEWEHSGIEFIHDDPESVVPFVEKAALMAPVAQAALLLHGRHLWQQEWFEQACFLLYGELPPHIGPSSATPTTHTTGELSDSD